MAPRGTKGHQATEGSGLRGHSCGDTHPFDYVTMGNGDVVITHHGAPVFGFGQPLYVSREEAENADLGRTAVLHMARFMAECYRDQGGLLPARGEHTGTWDEFHAARKEAR